jgi:hypothetical protein
MQLAVAENDKGRSPRRNPRLTRNPKCSFGSVESPLEKLQEPQPTLAHKSVNEHPVLGVHQKVHAMWVVSDQRSKPKQNRIASCVCDAWLDPRSRRKPAQQVDIEPWAHVPQTKVNCPTLTAKNAVRMGHPQFFSPKSKSTSPITPHKPRS